MLQARGICKTYGKGTAQETAVLKNVCADFQDGIFYAVIGKSGSGKSTLLNILSGLDTPDQGQVLMDDVDLFQLSRRERAILRRRRSGFIFQSYHLLQEHTAWDNIVMPYTLDHRKPDQTYINRVCTMLEIDHLMHKYPAQLSGGEQQRVAIARAVAHKPRIVFADEPTGNLDPQTGHQTLLLLKEAVTRLGTTLILVTHDMSVAQEAQQIMKVEGGTIQ
ncbi:MAG: ABC transporter ATP-binding protein [Firmicutes bacterium]|nr:ABC transporter ATP-binding protein [Bacillota bacterium]